MRPYYPEFMILLGRARNKELLARAEGADPEAPGPARLLLPEIIEAISRLRQGTYGYCEECDRPIPLERLRRIPHARLCIVCQVSQNRMAALRPSRP
jgi:hypothetical protein